MTTFITGARGFIGGRLLRRLQDQGQPVIGSGRGPGPTDDDHVWIPHHLGSGEPLELPDSIESVVHSAFVHPSMGVDDETVRRVNVEGTREVLDAAIAAGARRFVFVSSGAVYGHQDRPAVETDPLRPADLYGRSKAHAEAESLRARDQIDVTILRLFFPYGPGQTGRLVPGLVARVLSGEPVAVHPEGRPRINPIHIDDVALAMERVLDLDGHHVLNVAGPQTTDISSLVQQIAVFAGRDVTLEERLPPVGDLLGDTVRLEETLGMRPNIGLAEGLRAVVAEQLPGEVA